MEVIQNILLAVLKSLTGIALILAGVVFAIFGSGDLALAGVILGVLISLFPFFDVNLKARKTEKKTMMRTAAHDKKSNI